MKSPEELKAIIELARNNGCHYVEVDGIRFDTTLHVQSFNAPVPDLEAKEVLSPLSALDEYTDEEIKYWATPYFDELQAIKEAHRKKLQEEEEMRTA